ncbi:MAG: acylneuraminate cytidylyltransferase family protein [Defluviitaleaceae bacterium]|nr:acylneuraminate cytidylyltransferase family protein [Defluviitaleaceae bacterium]
MYKNKSFIAVIPARGGSKGIPHKNITPLLGNPLISYTIKAALESKYLDKVVVSTDDKKIANISRRYNVEILERPKYLADDFAASIDVLLHAIETMNIKHNAVLFLQPTSPLRQSFHIDEAIELFISQCCKPLVSVSPCNVAPLLIRKMSHNGFLSHLLKEQSAVRRQDMESYYKVNGAIYINTTDQLNKMTSLNDNEIGYVMDSKYDIDIDEPIDLKIAEIILKSFTIKAR